MSRNFQQEIPRARVNITLDVDSQGAKQKKELPLKLLLLGDFSATDSRQAISSQSRICLNRNNLNQCIARLAPKLTISIPNFIDNSNQSLHCTIQIRSIDDFHPDRLVLAHPALKKLIAMRYLLKDLKSSVLDNPQFRKRLSEILTNKTSQKSLMESLGQGE